MGYFELLQGLSVELKVTAGAPVATEDLKKPFFTSGGGALGYDFWIKDQRIQLALRLGVIAFADPIIMVPELVLGTDF